MPKDLLDARLYDRQTGARLAPVCCVWGKSIEKTSLNCNFLFRVYLSFNSDSLRRIIDFLAFSDVRFWISIAFKTRKLLNKKFLFRCNKSKRKIRISRRYYQSTYSHSNIVFNFTYSLIFCEIKINHPLGRHQQLLLPLSTQEVASTVMTKSWEIEERLIWVRLCKGRCLLSQDVEKFPCSENEKFQ